jgi:hypothetical protein
VTQKLFTRKQPAAMLAMSVGRLVEQEQAGKIVGLLDGRVVKYTVEEIDRFVAELPSHEPT